jgi:hypothetical protein
MLSRNKLIIKNFPVIIDVFFTVRNEVSYCVIIFNSGKEILQRTGIQVQNTQIQGNHVTFIKPNVTKTLETIDCVAYFEKGLHHDIAFVPMEYHAKIQISLSNGESYTFKMSQPCMDFVQDNIMTTIFKDEHRFLHRWIQYWKKMGFTKFILYDNSDTFSMKNYAGIDLQNVTLVHADWSYFQSSWTDQKSTIGQVIQQNHCLWKYPCKYIGFFDLDEFIHPKARLFDGNTSYSNLWFGCGKGLKQSYHSLETSKNHNRKLILNSSEVDYVCVHIPVTLRTSIRYSDEYFAHFLVQNIQKKRKCDCKLYCVVKDTTFQNV